MTTILKMVHFRHTVYQTFQLEIMYSITYIFLLT